MTTPDPSTDPGAPSLAAKLTRGATYATIAPFLEGLSAPARRDQILALRGAEVRALYHALEGAPALTPDDFWGGEPEGRTLVFEGRNSLPAASRFQKRFCKGPGGALVGYNHQSFAFATGPGYFVVSAGDATHPGELLFDYTREPPFVPEGWPPFRDNRRGLSRLVYYAMKDYCRPAAAGVVVGAAFKGGAAQNAYFALARALARRRSESASPRPRPPATQPRREGAPPPQRPGSATEQDASASASASPSAVHSPFEHWALPLALALTSTLMASRSRRALTQSCRLLPVSTYWPLQKSAPSGFWQLTLQPPETWASQPA